jgi:ribosomal protein S18 acetylase RimI-like enzyme
MEVLKQEIKIRQYQKKDAENIRHICWETALQENLRANPPLLNLVAVEYYLGEEPHNIFVAANENDECVGYILCAENSNKYSKNYRKKYLKALKNMKKGEACKKRFEFIFYRLVNPFYPAHLHIDILDDYQRMGIGHKLVNRLIAHLKVKRVKGLHLVVASNNEKGIGFYKKFGFKKRFNLFGQGYLYALNLKKIKP